MIPADRKQSQNARKAKERAPKTEWIEKHFGVKSEGGLVSLIKKNLTPAQLKTLEGWIQKG